MHTSEWRVEPGSMTTWTKVMRGSEQDGDLAIVAKTYAIVGYSAEDVANLIAAAPELLEQCKYLLENAGAAGWSEFMLADARAAIAKAEGRSE